MWIILWLWWIIISTTAIQSFQVVLLCGAWYKLCENAKSVSLTHQADLVHANLILFFHITEVLNCVDPWLFGMCVDKIIFLFKCECLKKTKSFFDSSIKISIWVNKGSNWHYSLCCVHNEWHFYWQHSFDWFFCVHFCI